MKDKAISRLSGSLSPYLLHHSGNPVNWYPWSQDAFDDAVSSDRPVFLSIGYSTCHWCHVMERESFSDPDVARLMNDAFISVKVDREERPDIDNLYMHACHVLTGSGGWPLSIIMTPDRIPFYAATYIPRESVHGRIGMLDLIPLVDNLWKNRKNDLVVTADRVFSILNSQPPRTLTDSRDSEIRRAYKSVRGSFDKTNGGFGTRPKFPTPHIILFLLRYWNRTGSSDSRHMVEKTLNVLSRGGIRDHIGSGFHRYATDPEWRIPHFEKMLYDQAMLSSAYLHAYLAFNNEEFAREAESILEYVLRELSSKEGAFYSAEDADSEGEEGRFYTWSHSELKKILTTKEMDLFSRAYGITEEGNFLEEATGRKTGRNILYCNVPFSVLSAETRIPEKDIISTISDIRNRLFIERNNRERPLMDTKILTDWNSLLISSLALAGRVPGKSSYTYAAISSADFILAHMSHGGHRLLHRYYAGCAGIEGTLDDYAFFIHALLELYETTLDYRFLESALSFQDTLLSMFIDTENGGFFFTASDSNDLPVRKKEIYGGPIPSGNAVALHNLVRLSGITSDPCYHDAAVHLIRSMSDALSSDPGAYTDFLISLDFFHGPATCIILAGYPGSVDTLSMLNVINSVYIPNRILLLLTPGQTPDVLVSHASYRKEMTLYGGKATAYICSDNSCSEPVNDPVLLRQILVSSL